MGSGMNQRFAESLEGRVLLAASPSIGGAWLGSRSEAGLRGTFANVTIEMHLKQSGQDITSTEHRSTPKDDEYFADLRSHGTFAGNVFAFQDDAITAQERPSNYKWLLYQGTLELSPDGQTLSGPWHAGGKRGSMTLQRLPLPRLVVNSAATRDYRSVTVDYSIFTAAIGKPLRFDVYRSSTKRLSSSSRLIGTQTLSPKRRADDLSVGPHRVRLFAGTALGNDSQFPYIIVVANGDGAVELATESLDSVRFR